MVAIIFSSTVCSRENKNIYIYIFFLWDVKELAFWIKGKTNIFYNHIIIVERVITKWEAIQKEAMNRSIKLIQKLKQRD